MPTIKLGAHEIEVSPPSSPSTRWALLEAVGEHRSMGLCACLGAAWATSPPLRARADRLGFKWERYGAVVMDELVARYNVTAQQVVAAGAQAFNLYDTRDLITEDEVKAAETFTPGREDSTD